MSTLIFFSILDEIDKLLNDVITPPDEEEELLNRLVNDSEDNDDGLNAIQKKGLNYRTKFLKVSLYFHVFYITVSFRFHFVYYTLDEDPVEISSQTVKNCSIY